MSDTPETPAEDAVLTPETPAEEPAVEVVEAVEEAPVAAAEEPAIEPAPLPTDRVGMKHPDGIGVSFAGHEFAPDADGVILVPAFAVAELSAHGFVPVA